MGKNNFENDNFPGGAPRMDTDAQSSIPSSDADGKALAPDERPDTLSDTDAEKVAAGGIEYEDPAAQGISDMEVEGVVFVPVLVTINANFVANANIAANVNAEVNINAATSANVAVSTNIAVNVNTVDDSLEIVQKKKRKKR